LKKLLVGGILVAVLLGINNMNEIQFDDYVSKRDWIYVAGYKDGFKSACWFFSGVVVVLLTLLIIIWKMK
jgi:1,4-dihydroxy-2-naphthoate octaprenyltransferase